MSGSLATSYIFEALYLRLPLHTNNKMEPDEPGQNFVEIRQIWEHHLSICPVEVIVYDSTGSKTVQFNSWRLCMFISFPNKRIFASHVVAIEVQQ